MAWLIAAIIILLNGKLVVDQLLEWQHDLGPRGWIITFIAAPAAVALAALLMWLIVRPERAVAPPPQTLHMPPPAADDVLIAAGLRKQEFRRIGVALEAKMEDSAMLAEAIAMARAHHAELVLMHVVEGAAGQWLGAEAGDAEARHDNEYLNSLAHQLQTDLASEGVKVHTALGFGAVKSELIRLVRQEKIDLLIAGGHGHRRISDILRGETINGVRHALAIPVLAVRGRKD
jgi:manganese transport protein